MRFHGIYWLLLLSALLLAITFVFISPVGHFISFFHTIVPVTLLVATFVHIFRDYSVATTSQRVLRLLYCGLSATILILIFFDTYGLFVDPFCRGKLFGL